MRNRRDNARRLRSAVDALPQHTKLGMLDGINGNRVIVGAYTDKRGGVCPMLAAHRNGGRTDFASFARAWDAYTGAKKARRASTREVRTLRGYLEAALTREGIAPPQVGDAPGAQAGWAADTPLAEAVRDIQASRRRLAEAEAHETSDVTIEELLAGTYAESEQERTERAAAEVLQGDQPVPSGS